MGSRGQPGRLAGLEQTECEKYHSCSAGSFQGKTDPRKSFLPLPLYGRNGLGSLEWLLDSQEMHGNQPKENPNPLSCLLVYGMPKLAFFCLFKAGKLHNQCLFQSHRNMAREAEACLKINLNFLKCLASGNTCSVQFEILSDKYMQKES